MQNWRRGRARQRDKQESCASAIGSQQTCRWRAYEARREAIRRPGSNPVKLGQTLLARISACCALARTVQAQNFSRRFIGKTGKFVMLVIKSSCGNAMILCTEKQQRHRRLPAKVQRLGKDEDHLSV